ncbi:hypothetical protein FBU30_005141 [Linnemannia zychae]|nr:hypothetical protein FBU30_005141 [Linnemannia zychae]
MDPRKLKVNELKEQLQLAGLSVIGKKEELVARLLEHQKAEEEATLAAGPPTGTGEAFNWEDPIDELAPPASDAPAKAIPATTTTSVTKAAVAKEPTTTAGATTTPNANTAKPATGAANSVQFQGVNVNDADALKAEIEKRKNRAARFGTPLTEQDKALERAARFGVPVTASATASLAKAAGTTKVPAGTAGTKGAVAAKSSLPAKPTSIATQIPADVLAKRQERFGVVVADTKKSTVANAGEAKKPSFILDAAEEEKKRKRAAKFGLPTAEDEASKKAKV